ncbi:MAG: N-acetylmuramoyl-L-alanine amidase [Tenuifilaceae bacterium]
MTFVFKSTYFRSYAFAYLLLTAFFFINYCAIGQKKESYGIKKVVIDPGHGGRDPGTVGSKSYEKDIALSISLKFGALISKNLQDVEIIYTRNHDKSVPLDERSKIANASGADLFISIHCNSSPSKSAYGTETYVLGLHKSEDNLDVAMRENAVITYEEDYSSKYEGYDPKSTESFIIFTLMQNSFIEQSLSFANDVQTEFKQHAKRYNRGVKQAGFLVLWKASMPSVLIEVGYLSNAREEAYLTSEAGQNSIASAIYRAFDTYKKHIDNRSSFTTVAPIQKDTDSNTNVSASDTKSTKEPIIFKVQITSSRKKIPTNSNYFKNLKDVDEITSDGIYKYVVGNEKSYQEIVDYCQQIRKLFPDAFIIATKGGKTVPIDRALKELSI